MKLNNVHLIMTFVASRLPFHIFMWHFTIGLLSCLPLSPVHVWWVWLLPDGVNRCGATCAGREPGLMYRLPHAYLTKINSTHLGYPGPPSATLTSSPLLQGPGGGTQPRGTALDSLTPGWSHPEVWASDTYASGLLDTLADTGRKLSYIPWLGDIRGSKWSRERRMSSSPTHVQIWS